MPDQPSRVLAGSRSAGTARVRQVEGDGFMPRPANLPEPGDDPADPPAAAPADPIDAAAVFTG
jgi:hypothetical protein